MRTEKFVFKSNMTFLTMTAESPEENMDELYEYEVRVKSRCGLVKVPMSIKMFVHRF